MEKLNTCTSNIVSENISKIKELFPNCVTEGKDSNGNTTLKVNFETLKQELSDDVIKNSEKYEFTWPGKNESIRLANQPTDNTLRPCKEESVNWDTTQNLYIEGDNLEVLKILRDAYFKKIKLIYIDPPYNTGKDFIYKDNYSKNAKEYLRETNQVDDDENRLVQNKETNGRFHTDWLNMMYPRLKLARDLLTDDGVIFISIDDNEQANLKKVCDEVFGAENFVATCPRKTRSSATTKSDAEFQKLNDYILVYWKNKFNSAFNLKFVGKRQYPYSDENGKYYTVPLQDNGPHGTRTARPNLYYPIYQDCVGNLSLEQKNTNDKKLLPSKHKNDDGRWMWSKGKFQKDCKYLCVKNEKVYIKHYFDPNENQNRYQREKNWFDKFENQIMNQKWFDNYMNSKGTVLLNNTMKEKGVFDNPKPVELIKLFINMSTNEYDIIVDFFSGSATTAHAVMQLNAQDGGNRKFIMVQLPEPCNEKSEAFKEGYINICEIGKERIRKAGKKIIEETGKTDLDVGFRVLKLDSSNMKKTHYLPKEYNLSLIKNNKLYENIKEDRTPEDLLIQSMLKIGIFLSSPIKEEFLENKRFFNVNNDELICYFDDNLTDDLVEKILDKHKNLKYFVTRDSAVDDNTLINVDPLVKIYNPNLKWEVI